MRVSPTPEQLEYLASLGVSVATPPARTTRRSARRQNNGARDQGHPQTLRARASLGLVSGFCSGAIGLVLGGFFGLITHGLGWGFCLAVCTAIGWFMIGFLWSFGWTAEKDLHQSVRFSKAQIGIRISIGLAAVAFAACFVGMLLAVMISGPATARAWIRGCLLVIWVIGLLPGSLLTVVRWIQAQRP